MYLSRGYAFTLTFHLLVGVGKDGRTLDVDAKLPAALNDGSCEFWLKVLRTIPEISLCGPHVGSVGHRVFTSFRKPEYGVGQLFLFFVA